MTATQERINAFNVERIARGKDPMTEREISLLAKIRTSAGPMGFGVLPEEYHDAYSLWMRGWVTTDRTQGPRYYRITDIGIYILRAIGG